MLGDKKKDKEKEKDKKKDKKKDKHDKDRNGRFSLGASLSSVKNSTDDAHPIGINRSSKSLDLLASFPIAAINTANIYKTIGRKTTNKFATLSRYANKSLRDLHTSSDDEFNITVENTNFPIIQVDVFCDSAEVTREITVQYPPVINGLEPASSVVPTVQAMSNPSATTNISPSSLTSSVPQGSSHHGSSGVVIITGLPKTTDPSSIRVKGVLGSATILEVSYNKQIDLQGRPQPSPTELLQINAQIQELEDQITLKKNVVKRLTKEKDFLYKYTQRLSSAGEQGGSLLARGTLEGLIRWTDLHSEMLASISLRDQEATKELDELKHKHEKAVKQRSDLSPSSSEESRNVVVSLFVPKANAIVLQLSYVTRNVKWTPSYDIRVISGSDVLEVTYHAQITQSTGEDWKNVPLSLSTGSPARGVPPELKASTVSFSSKIYDQHSADSNPLVLPNEENNRRSSTEKVTDARVGNIQQGSLVTSNSSNPTISAMVAEGNTTSSLQTTTLSSSASNLPVPYPSLIDPFGSSPHSSHSFASANFTISRVGSIDSNGKGHKVTIAMLTLLSKYMYFAVPKLSPNAFLKASATNTTEYPLLPGIAQIFFDTSFVTSCEMKLVQPGEDFETHLGIDRGVKVEWKTPQRYSESGGMLAKVQHLTLASTTIIRNTKDKSIMMTLSDNLPRPNDERIKVRVLEPDLVGPQKSITSVKLNPNNQVLEWLLEVGPAEEIRIPFKYSIEWPKNQDIDIF